MNNTVYLCDCMDYMKGLPDNAFDLAIVDPPYGVGDFSQAKRPSKKYNRSWRVDWNDVPPELEYFDEIYRISNHQIIWGANYYRQYIPYGGSIIWDKGNKSDIGSQAEIAATDMQERVSMYFEQWAGFCRTEKDVNKIHPCQKPVGLYAWILRKYAKQGQTIFDSHVGSGSIRIACHDMGYDFTGCELDPDYHAAQEDRFNTHKAQGQLFDPAELTKKESVQVAL